MRLHLAVRIILLGVMSFLMIGIGKSSSAHAMNMNIAMQPGEEPAQIQSAILPSASAATIQFGGALGFHYSPSLIFISPGDTVTWQGDFSMHPLVSDEGDWTTPTSGSTFSQTFTKPGAYHFHCFFHGAAGGIGMSGTILVGFHAFLPLQVKGGTVPAG